jgi:hypothetical protein
MSEKPISPLRQRMLEDMSVRRFTPDTQREYIRAVKRLAAFLGRTPDTATAEDLRAFQLHPTLTGVRPPTVNATVTALRFFFKVTLDQPETTRHLVFVYEPRKLPRVLSPEEVLRLLEAAPSPKAVPAVDAGEACGNARGGATAVLRRPRVSGGRKGICGIPRPAQKEALVSSIPSARSQVRRPCLPTCRATPTVSPSQTAA